AAVVVHRLAMGRQKKLGTTLAEALGRAQEGAKLAALNVHLDEVGRSHTVFRNEAVECGSFDAQATSRLQLAHGPGTFADKRCRSRTIGNSYLQNFHVSDAIHFQVLAQKCNIFW